MKKILYFLPLLAFLTACDKEALVNEDVNNETNGEVHELFVSIADMADADTKAAISSTDGTFTWTAGDAIAVKTSTNDVYQFTAQTGGSASARFTYTGAMNGTPAQVKYPYTADFSNTALPTEIASLTGALAAGAIRMSGTISENSVTLSHTNALMKVKFTNVPTFASKIVFDGDVNDVTISGISLGSRGNVVAYIPVDAATTSFTVTLKDDNNNTIATKSTTSKSFTAGTIKNMKAVDVEGWVFTFDDAYDYADQAKFFSSSGWSDSEPNYSNEKDLTLNTLSDGTTKWCILEANGSWIQSGYFVCLQIFKGGSYMTATKGLCLKRDFDFTIKDDKGIVTDYRIYFYLNSSNSQTHWGSTASVQLTKDNVDDKAYSMTLLETNLFYYGHDTSDYGKKIKYQFRNGGDWYEPSGYGATSSEVTLDREFWYDMNN